MEKGGGRVEEGHVGHEAVGTCTVAASLVARKIKAHLSLSQHATGSPDKEEGVQCAARFPAGFNQRCDDTRFSGRLVLLLFTHTCTQSLICTFLLWSTDSRDHDSKECY